MPDSIFSSFETIRYEGASTESDLAYRWYDPSKVVRGKTLSEHLRFAVAYWHSLCMNGSDPFGGPTINRAWNGAGDSFTNARLKADAAFDLLRVLDIPLFTFHDRDVV